MKENKIKKASPWKSIKVGLITLLILVIFAYGFQVTKVNLEELRSEQRLASMTRVIRALVKPDLIEFDQIEEIVNVAVYVPCPKDDNLLVSAEPVDLEPYLVVTPACGDPGEILKVEGYNFAPNTEGPLRFVPGNDPEYTVALGRDIVKTDENGSFSASFTLPDRLSDENQFIRVTLRRNVGSPYFTKTAHDTWDRIIETVFMALLATVFGTVLAIPISFIAARNLMKPVKSPLMSVSLSLIGWPVGMALGFLAIRWVGSLSAYIIPSIWINVIAILGASVLAWFGMRWALPQEEIKPPRRIVRILRWLVLLLVVLLVFFALFQTADLAKNAGLFVESKLGAFDFLGNFLFQVGDIIQIITPVLGALAAGGALGGFLGKLGVHSTEKLPPRRIKLANLVLTGVAGAILFGLLGQLIEILYQIGVPAYTLWGPMVAGALLGFLLALIIKPKKALMTGIIIYYITRTILNTTRSIEALVMAIVFVIAVGIGPFAGALALGLHTIVSLAKLFSEQVESILSGPLEAVEATGANRLQTIVYAVVPQIIPPYISYTMYRWDTNVRMSTIIGFVGGGGIGFLLQQNINLLNYRAASAQMIAIAVVVALMDYVSSVLREKFI